MQVWQRCQRGSELLLSTERKDAEKCSDLLGETMSDNSGSRYCKSFSYTLLKFFLFSYACVFWVSVAVNIDVLLFIREPSWLEEEERLSV